MGMYRHEWDCCDSVTETDAWEPEECPLCKVDEQSATITRLTGDLQVAESVADQMSADAKHLRAEVARLTRERDDLRVDAEVLSDRYAEVRALADTYIDIVNRTARALGIPEVDEDGAMPSLHDVPERVERVVRERDEHFRWAYRLLLRLAQYRLADVNNRRGEPEEWPAGQKWSGLGGSSRGVFLRQARDEAGVDSDAFLRVVRSGDGPCIEDLWDEADGWPVPLGANESAEEPTDDDATRDPPGWSDEEVPDAR